METIALQERIEHFIFPVLKESRAPRGELAYLHLQALFCSEPKKRSVASIPMHGKVFRAFFVDAREARLVCIAFFFSGFPIAEALGVGSTTVCE